MIRLSYAADGNLMPRPQIASGHEVSDDGRIWRIRLRDGLRFHDATPVRAADCIASLHRPAYGLEGEAGICTVPLHC
ncbi:MAG: ABC transporter substrate-binding protein [Acetobacteraceae bacterium]